MQVNTIYPAFNGEMSVHGIGSLTVFLRLQGCHLRCYATTFGHLCDTPEGLSAEGGKTMTVSEIMDELLKLRVLTGIRRVCLTGGDPLWRKPAELHELFGALESAGYSVTVETSGTLDWRQYNGYNNVAWVLDYKLRSAGVKGNLVLVHAGSLRKRDYVKFVVYGEEDYAQMKEVLFDLWRITEAKITVGPMWEGQMNAFVLFDRLKKDGMLALVTGGINFQAHKLVEHAAFNPPMVGQVLSRER